MTTYEVLVAKGEGQGIVKGERIHLLKTIWNAHSRQLSVSNISAVLNIAPSMVNKWLKRFEWMSEGEAEGLTPAEIMLKVNELAVEPVVMEWEVIRLLAFSKSNLRLKRKRVALKKTI